MTAITSKEFMVNQKKYFDLAIKEDVLIKRGRNRFHLIHSKANDTSEYDEILEPDEEFYKALTAEEFKEKALKMVEKVHYQFYPKK